MLNDYFPPNKIKIPFLGSGNSYREHQMFNSQILNFYFEIPSLAYEIGFDQQVRTGAPAIEVHQPRLVYTLP